MSDEYIKNEKIIETRWHCPSCGADNLGRDMKCTACSAPKDESSQYVVDESAAEVRDQALLEDARAGAHWVCAYCEKQNRGRKDICGFCGVDQATGKRPPKPEAPPPLPTPKKKPNLLLGCGILLGAVVGVLALLIWIGLMGRIDAKVVALKWEQQAHLHERTLMNKDGWQDEVPSDAFDSSCERKQRTTRQVVDRYRTVNRTRSVKYQSGTREECREVTKDLGNGFASQQTVCKNVPVYDYRDEHYTEQEPVYRTEPVYDQYCRYKRFEWPTIRTVSRTGEGHGGYSWPPTSELGEASCVDCALKEAHDGLKRCCSQQGIYTVVFQRSKQSKDPEENKPLDYVAESLADYETFKIGDEHVIEIDNGTVKIIRD